ncbi:MAG: carboxypeptidase regulatory-like domain-containing protein [Rhizobacter sp.]|nr:carboxypeptidase regulatory-like domain-containing protein [Chlorobiales bacterium]
MKMTAMLMMPAIIMLLMLTAASGCREESPAEAELLTVEITLVPPVSNPQLNIAGARVQLRSLERSRTDTAFTVATGVASFSGVVPGKYDITARAANKNAAIFGVRIRQRSEAAVRLQIP